VERSSRASTVLDLAARWRSIAISGTRPNRSAISSSGPPSSVRQVKGPPIGPRNASSSPGAKLPGQVGGDLAVIDSLDRQCELCALRRRCDRVRALSLVAVIGGEPDVDVLAGGVPSPDRHVEHYRLGARGLVDEAGDGRDSPHDRFSLANHRAVSPWWPSPPLSDFARTRAAQGVAGSMVICALNTVNSPARRSRRRAPRRRYGRPG
jgi:hypothetical protein